MGITDPGGPRSDAEHDDLGTPSDGDPAGGHALPDERPSPPARRDDPSDGGQGGDEYPYEDPSPS